MTDQSFVARERELTQLHTFLDRALAGQGQVCFVVGEPGIGKTSLLLEFAQRAQFRHDGLIVAVGNCNAQTGIGQAFLPFREVLAMLTGDLEAKIAQGAITAENASRIRKVGALTGLILLEVASDLIDVWLPSLKMVYKVGRVVGKQAGLDKALAQTAKHKPTGQDLTQMPVDQEHIFEQCTNFLCKMAGEHPLVIMLDDLQWADASSLSLLFHVGRRIEKFPILIVGAYRRTEVALGRSGERHPLEKLQSEFKRRQGEVTIALDRLDDTEVREFVDAVLDAYPNSFDESFRQALCEHTGGNPLFITELLHNMQERGVIVEDSDGLWALLTTLDWDNLPARVEGVIQERLDRLDRESYEVVANASVEGQTFTAEVLAKLLSAEDRDIVRRLSTELGRKHHLVEPAGMDRSGGQRLSFYEFAQKLVRDYLYECLDEIERAYLHEDIGNILEALYTERLDEVAVQLAWHFMEAGATRKAVEYLKRAGDLAVASFAHEEALQHFTLALEVAPENELQLRCELLLAREAVFNWQGRRQEQRQDLQSLTHLSAQIDDSQLLAEIHLRHANYDMYTGNYEKALEQAQFAVTVAEKGQDIAREAKGYALWARTLFLSSRYQEARDWFEVALDMSHRAQDMRLVARIIYDLGLNDYACDHYGQARANFEKAQAMYVEMAHRKGEINCLLMLGILEIRSSKFVGGLAYLQQALARSRESGWRTGEAYVLGSLGTAYLEVGDYENAIHYHQEALLLCQEFDDKEGAAVSLDALGQVYHRLERNDAQAFFQEALAIDREIGYRRGEGYVLTHWGHVLLDLNRWEEARDAFHQALTIRRELDPDSGVSVDDLAGLARAVHAQGNLEHAVAWATEAIAWMDTHGPDRVEYPVLAYLLCYQVLLDASRQDPGQEQAARSVLEKGLRLLQEQIHSIEDAKMRDAFVQNVPFNRELMTLE